MARTNETTTNDSVHLAYIARGEFEDGKAYRAGALIVNAFGAPLEFRCTSPVRPNLVQRTLYGSSLEPFMLVELMGKPLIGGLRESLDLLVVGEPSLLNLRRDGAHPTIYVRPQGADLGGPRVAGDEHAMLIEPQSQRFQPVVVQVFPEHAGDLEAARLILQTCSTHFDVMEPFQRILKALEKVHQEKTLDQ
jgi:hypothetical protein